MAIYHLSAKPVSRGAGRSATAAIAYRASERIVDERTGEIHDYARRSGVEHSEIVLPLEAVLADVNWARDRAALWNEAERCERRKDARVAREYELALPHELSADERIELVREFAQHVADRHGCAVDVAIHAPHRLGDERNHHAHVLATTRQVVAGGLGEKTVIELSDTARAKRGLGPGRDEVAAIRAAWAGQVNRALQVRGHRARVDHRSLRAQGIQREPTRHLGVAATGFERRTGQASRVRLRIEREVAERLQVAREAGVLERALQRAGQSVLDLSGQLSEALAERDKLQEAQRRDQLLQQGRARLAAVRAERDASLTWAESARRMRAEQDRQENEKLERHQRLIEQIRKTFEMHTREENRKRGVQSKLSEVNLKPKRSQDPEIGR